MDFSPFLSNFKILYCTSRDLPKPDRDPKLFAVILNFLRTKEISHPLSVDVSALRHEAEFYGIASLVKRLILCEDLDHSGCGDVLFHGCIHPPSGLFDDDVGATSGAAGLLGVGSQPTLLSSTSFRGENAESSRLDLLPYCKRPSLVVSSIDGYPSHRRN